MGEAQLGCLLWLYFFLSTYDFCIENGFLSLLLSPLQLLLCLVYQYYGAKSLEVHEVWLNSHGTIFDWHTGRGVKLNVDCISFYFHKSNHVSVSSN